MRAAEGLWKSIQGDMQHHADDTASGLETGIMAGEPGTDVRERTAPSRREIIVGGGLLLGSLLLAGCGDKKSLALPGPYWSDPSTTNSLPTPTAVVTPLPSQPTIRPQPAVIQNLPTPGIVPRSQWTRSGIARPKDINPMNGVRRITIHHDGMPVVSLGSSSEVSRRIEQIRSSHVVGRGWADIGYHYVVDPQGRIWEGRSISKQGAHVKDQNENNLGILVLGNFDRQSPSQAALASLDKFIANQMQRYGIGMSQVRTHMERDSTSCPGRNLQQYMVRTRSGNGTLYAMANRVGLARG